ncbi:MAG: GNAT family N-acetyltransferase [Alphaproteobacteria bacterium]|nr:GNAT family N-acetyltransferase [Alphaproteobacteria bacterium]
MKIRPATEKDFDEIWKIFRDVIATEDTYVNRAETTWDEAYTKWMDKEARILVAELNDKIVGASLLKPNRVDLGSHVANASFIVDVNTRKAGVGKALALHALTTAKSLGYRAMQFNFVVSTNTAAVKLWKSVGFSITGIIPGGFKHKTLGYVDAYVMFKKL